MQVANVAEATTACVWRDSMRNVGGARVVESVAPGGDGERAADLTKTVVAQTAESLGQERDGDDLGCIEVQHAGAWDRISTGIERNLAGKRPDVGGRVKTEARPSPAFAGGTRQRLGRTSASSRGLARA